MFAGIGRFAARRRGWVVTATVLYLLFAGIWGSGAFSTFGGGAGFDDPGSESAAANVILAGPLGRHATDVVVLVTSAERTVDDPAFAAAVAGSAARVPPSSVDRIDTFWTTGSPDLVSADRRSTYVGMQLAGASETENVALYRETVKDRMGVDGFEVRYGGLVPVNDQVNELAGRDILRAELISLPILLVLLVLIFRSVVAAALPLMLAAVVAVGSLGVLRVLGSFADISTFSINIVTLLGLGLSIDYALIVVNRFREELAAGRTVDDAVARTMATAGRTVAFSGVAIAVTLVGLVIFPSRFLVSMAYAIVAVALFAVLSSLVVLPALLRIAGHRIDALRVPLPRIAGTGGWYRVAHAVMRRPIAATVGITLALLAVATPMLGAQWGRPSDWVLPAGADARVVDDVLDAQFPRDPTATVTAVVRLPGPADASALVEFAARLDGVPGVDGAAVTGIEGNLARLTLGYAMDPQSTQAREMVAGVRAEAPPAGATVLFTNYPVSLADMLAMLGAGLPWLALYMAVVSGVVLFMAFGSVVVPVASLALNVVSAAATFGVIALIFQFGLLSDVLGFVPAGFMDANMPMLIFVIAFGLAIDYQVFTLSRIRERWLATGDHDESVAVGVQQSARIISSAAALFVVAVGGFVFGSVTFSIMIGVGLVTAVVIDATIVRGLLVPATMRLIGERIWWAPRPLAHWWARWGIPEEVSAGGPGGGGTSRPPTIVGSGRPVRRFPTAQ